MACQPNLKRFPDAFIPQPSAFAKQTNARETAHNTACQLANEALTSDHLDSAERVELLDRALSVLDPLVSNVPPADGGGVCSTLSLMAVLALRGHLTGVESFLDRGIMAGMRFQNRLEPNSEYLGDVLRLIAWCYNAHTCSYKSLWSTSYGYDAFEATKQDRVKQLPIGADLCMWLLERHDRHGEGQCLSNALYIARTALSSLSNPGSDEDRGHRLHFLMIVSAALYRGYILGKAYLDGPRTEIRDGAQTCKEVLQLLPHEHADRPIMELRYAFWLTRQDEGPRTCEDSALSRELIGESKNLDDPAILFNLDWLLRYHDPISCLTDRSIELCVKLIETYIELQHAKCTFESLDVNRLFETYIFCLKVRALQTQEPKYREAIETILKQYLQSLIGDPSQTEAIVHLSFYLEIPYVVLGSHLDLARCLQVSMEILEKTLPDDPQRIVRLEMFEDRLSAWLSIWNEKIPSNGETMIRYARELVQRAPSKHRAKRAHSILSDLLLLKFDSNGDLPVLNDCIGHKHKQLQLSATEEHPEIKKTLADRIRGRYLDVGTQSDLDRAVELLRDVAGSMGDSEVETSLGCRVYSSLSTCHQLYYLRQVRLEDAERSRKYADQALSHMSPNLAGFSEYGEFMHTQGLARTELARLLKGQAKEEALDRSIGFYERALKSTPTTTLDSRNQNFTIRENLAWALEMKFVSSSYQDTASGTRSIDLRQEVLRRTDNNSALRGGTLLSLGKIMIDRAIRSTPYLNNHDTSEVEGDLERALDYLCQCVGCHNAPPPVRIEAATQSVRAISRLGTWSKGVVIFEQAIVEVLPLLNPRSLSRSDAQFKLQFLSQLGALGATAVLNEQGDVQAVGEGTRPEERALELLEQARGVMEGLRLESRRAAATGQPAPGQASHARYMEVQGMLEKMNSERALGTDVPLDQWITNSRARHDLSQELQSILSDIQRPDLGHPTPTDTPSLDEVITAAGPNITVVVITSTPYRHGDVFFINRTGQYALRHKRLTGLRRKDLFRFLEASRRHRPKVSISMLSWAWRQIAMPILAELGYYPPLPLSGTRDGQKRLCWVLTGSLSEIPIHAAGSYDDPNNKVGVMDCVVSSYSTTLRAFVQSRSNPSTKATSGKALLVGAHDSDLPKVPEEMERVGELCASLGLEYRNDNVHNPRWATSCTKKDILSRLSRGNYAIFHFAGHGVSHPDDPSLSSLCLANQDELTVADLYGMSIERPSSQRPFMAYLSACLTGTNDRVSLADESVHLIGAFQLAGFRHVVGTSWQVTDPCCVDVAESVYKEIKARQWDDEAVSRGLHGALLSLRDQWIRNELADFEKGTRHRDRKTEPGPDEKPDDSIWAVWVPFVHYGS